MSKGLIIGASLGNCVHVAGVVHFLNLAEDQGYETLFVGPAVKVDDILRLIEEHEPGIVALSYRLTPENAVSIVKELQEKLAYKAYLNANLYYKLGNYKGNNYQSAVIAATNAIKEYPNSKHREELALIILKSKFQHAEKSVLEKQEDRYRDTVDEYYNFINDFPNSKYANEARAMFEKAQRQLK